MEGIHVFSPKCFYRYYHVKIQFACWCVLHLHRKYTPQIERIAVLLNFMNRDNILHSYKSFGKLLKYNKKLKNATVFFFVKAQ